MRNFASVLICLLFAPAVFGQSPLRPVNLRCEYLVDPMGIDVVRPRLSWQLESDGRGRRQTAYHIIVSSTPQAFARDEGDLWDSGKVQSAQTLHIQYAGKGLQSRVAVWWKVRVWDEADTGSEFSQPARWTMGLLAESDWTANWIELARPKVTFVAAHNGYHSAMATAAESAKWVVIDLGRPRTFDGVQLHPSQPWDAPNEPVGYLFPVRYRIEASDSADFKSFTILADNSTRDQPNPGAVAPLVRFKPATARYVRLFVTKLAKRKDAEFAFALAQMRILSGKDSIARGSAAMALDAVDVPTWSIPGLTNGRLLSDKGTQPPRYAPVQFRRELKLDAPVRRATVYSTALGLYELRINGQLADSALLSPDWTDYRKRIQYQAMDITRLLKQGDNAIAAIVADGWYAGRVGLAPPPGYNVFGHNPALLAQIEIELENGKSVTLVTDETWRCTDTGPIRSSDLLDGEVYDARQALAGWDVAGFDDSAGKRAGAAPRPLGGLVARMNAGIELMQEIKPAGLAEPQPGVYVFDLGQNIVGTVRLTGRAATGTTIRLRHAEALNPDGTLYTANLRSAAQADQYTFGSNELETWFPRFTLHGFQYVEVTGLPSRPPLDFLAGRVVRTSAPEVSRFECSDARLNKLMQNILWTQRGNFVSVPTDCPQRDGRLGGLGDAQVFAQAACFNMDMAAFFTKFMEDVRDGQDPSGVYPDVAPKSLGGAGAPGWADAGVILPWRLYENYGDKRILERHLDSNVRWIESVKSRNPSLIWKEHRGNDYNDWLNADKIKLDNWPESGGEVPKDVLATAFFAHSAQLISRSAAALGRSDDAERYAKLFDDIRVAFNNAFVKPDGRIEGDTQAGYALAPHFDLLPANLRPGAVDHLLENVKKYKGHLSTGIQTTNRAMLELSRTGNAESAWQLLMEKTAPTWMYAVDQGATTVWERWDGYIKGRGFADPAMNSLNHYAFGAVGEWVWRNAAGINPDPDRPGYEHIIINPRPGGGVTWVKAEYRSIRGPIRVEWKVEGDKYTLDVALPPNTRGTVHVKTALREAVTEGGKPAEQSPRVRFVRYREGAAVYEVEGGGYSFQSKLER